MRLQGCGGTVKVTPAVAKLRAGDTGTNAVVLVEKWKVINDFLTNVWI